MKFWTCKCRRGNHHPVTSRRCQRCGMERLSPSRTFPLVWQKIRKRMRSKGVSCEEFKEKIGVNPSKNRVLHYQRLIQIMDLLNVTPDWLFSEEIGHEYVPDQMAWTAFVLAVRDDCDMTDKEVIAFCQQISYFASKLNVVSGEVNRNELQKTIAQYVDREGLKVGFGRTIPVYMLFENGRTNDKSGIGWIVPFT